MRKLLIAVAIAFLFISCDTESMDNQQASENKNILIGTWESQGNVPSNMPNKIVFTEDKMIGYDENGDIKSFPAPGYPDITLTWEGTYSYNDAQIFIHLNSSNITVEYEFKNNILHFGGSQYAKK